MGLTISATAGNTENIFHVLDGDRVVEKPFSQAVMLEDVEDGEKPVTLVGYSDPFELTSEAFGTSTMVRLLWEIGSGHEQAGGLFSTMFGLKVGPKARLREVIVAAIGRDLKTGEDVDFDDLIGKRIILSTKGEVNSKGYLVVKYVSSRPAKKPASKKDLWNDAE